MLWIVFFFEVFTARDARSKLICEANKWMLELTKVEIFREPRENCATVRDGTSLREGRADVPSRIAAKLSRTGDKMDKVTRTSKMRLLSPEIESDIWNFCEAIRCQTSYLHPYRRIFRRPRRFKIFVLGREPSRMIVRSKLRVYVKARWCKREISKIGIHTRNKMLLHKKIGQQCRNWSKSSWLNGSIIETKYQKLNIIKTIYNILVSIIWLFNQEYIHIPIMAPLINSIGTASIFLRKNTYWFIPKNKTMSFFD